jgi:hypothetical protein
MLGARRFLLALIVVVAAATGLAQAEEIIYFTNGTSMPIRDHEVRGDMIHVDLGDDAFMAFPMRMVDRVEKAGKQVILAPSFNGGNKRAGKPKVADNDGSFPVTAQTPGRYKRGSALQDPAGDRDDPTIDRDEHGVTVYRPHAGSGNAKARLAAAGNQAAIRARTDAARFGGGRKVVGGKLPSNLGAGAKKPVGVQQIRGRSGPQSSPSGSSSGSTTDQSGQSGQSGSSSGDGSSGSGD